MSMSGRTESSSSAVAGHPPALLRAERSYFVEWGRRETNRAALGTAGGTLAALALGWALSPWWLLLLAPVLAAGGLLILFFRNPRREAPTGPVLVAPADGRVIEVETVDEPEYIGGPAHKVGIFLSIFDVHVNRAPTSGVVEYAKRRPGRYLDARDPRSSRENESRATGILSTEPGAGGLKVLVRQISGAIARRIICPLETGQAVERGRLMGMIKYGSRTELFVPAPRDGSAPVVQVKVGDRVRGGETVLYRYGVPPVVTDRGPV
jgi:phosphatidylserine decarboxylase